MQKSSPYLSAGTDYFFAHTLRLSAWWWHGFGLGDVVLLEFRELFEKLLMSVVQRLWVPESQALAKLLSVGSFQHVMAWPLFREYREWGLVHLLVLSGSQFYSFAQAWVNISLGFQKLFAPKPSKLWSLVVAIPICVFYLWALGLPPPLLRCALLWGFALVLRQKQRRLLLVCAVAFITQFVFFEEAQLGNSAFLSWFAFGSLLLVREISERSWVQSACLTLILQGAVSVLKGIEFSYFTLIVAVFSNLLCLPLFERIVFPLIGYISAFCLFYAFLWNPATQALWEGLLSPALSVLLEIALLPVLVVNGVFRYTLL